MLVTFKSNVCLVVTRQRATFEKFRKWLSIKDSAIRVKEVCTMQIREGGAENFKFFEIYGMSEWTKGRVLEPVRTKGKGFNFLRFFADALGQ